MDVSHLGLFDGVAYPRYPPYDDPAYDATRATDHFYAEPFGDRSFVVYLHSPFGGPGGQDDLVGNAEYKVSRRSWAVELLYPGERYTRHAPGSTDEEPRTAAGALEAILSFAHQQRAGTVGLPVYLSGRWPAQTSHEERSAGLRAVR